MSEAFRIRSSRFAIVLIASVLVSWNQAFANDESDESICPNHLHDRTTDQVLQAHAAAFVTGDAGRIACDYAEDAIFILPGSVATGRSQVQATFAYFLGLAGRNRSEEHTSELQSPCNLVCRLLLEKKKKNKRDE